MGLMRSLLLCALRLCTLLLCPLLFCQAALAQTPRTISSTDCTVYDTEIRGSYSGQCNAEGRAEGQGKAVGAAARYEGQFVNGTKHGRGTKTWLATGDQYVGEFVNDYRDGSGSYTWGTVALGQKPERYTGQFEQDLRHGWGLFEWRNGDVYTGRWERDAQAGPLTAMQQIKRRHADALAKLIGTPGTSVCLAADNKISAVVAGYQLGLLRLHGPGKPQEQFNSPVELWRRC